jgi:TIR domain
MTNKTDRRWILLSHANPEDNPATIWFATQLANEGYRVWSDVIDLTGGEDFWDSIEEVIRYRAAKVVYLLSPASNSKEGCRRELSVAQGVAKAEKLNAFVIPLRISDVSHNDANIRIHTLNILESQSWNVGLGALLVKLRQDDVPRGPPNDFTASSAWWKSRFATSQSVRNQTEALSSNRFRVINPQLRVYWHRLGCSELGPIEAPQNFPWPAVEDSGGIWTFAPANVVAAHLPPTYRVERTSEKTLLNDVTLGQAERDAGFRLLSRAWQAHLQNRGLLKYELANSKHCFAFPDGLIEDNEIQFQTAIGRKGRRTVVGYKTRINAEGKQWKRFWHFAIQPIPAFWPELMVVVRTHVVFGESGNTLWTSPTRIQNARRNQCKNWWNDTWRDRLLAVMSWLAAGSDSVRLDVGAEEPIAVAAMPIAFESPVRYLAPVKDKSDSAIEGEPLDDRREEPDEDESLDDDDDDEERVL